MNLDLSHLTLPNLNALLAVAHPSAREQVQAEIDRRTGRTPSDGEGAVKAAEANAAPDPFSAREAEQQREIRRIFLKRGAAVYWLSQPRKSGQTRGVPDLLVFDPHRGLVFVEAKGAGGKVRPEQLEFRQRCLAAGVHHVLGGVLEVRAFLLDEDAARSK